MHFPPTDQSRAFGNKALTEAALSGLLYGPFTLAILLFFAQGKLRGTPLLPYGYGFAVALVLFVFYYNNIVRRGRLFSRIMDTVWVAEGKLYYRTNPWLFTKPTEGALALKDVAWTRKTILSLQLIECCWDPGLSTSKPLYLIENSLVNEPALLDILAQWPKHQ